MIDINKYYDRLHEAKTYDELLNLFNEINEMIDSLDKDNVELEDLDSILNLISTILVSLEDQKRKEVTPLYVEETNDVISMARPLYVKLNELIGKNAFLDVSDFVDSNMDITNMNEWLKEVFDYYKEKGYDVGYLDFENIFTDDIADYERKNSIINEYMKTFFETNGDESKLIDVVLNGDFTLTDKINPILDYIVEAINLLNKKHSDLFSDELLEINKIAEELGYENIKLKDLHWLKTEARNKLENLSLKQDKLDKGDYSDLLVGENLSTTKLNSYNRDLIINRVCKELCASYDSKEEEDKKEYVADLAKIIEIIVKYKEYLGIKEDLLEYLKNDDFQNLFNELKKLRLNIKLLDDTIEKEEKEYSELNDKKTNLFFTNKKKSKKLKEFLEKIKSFRVRRDEINNKLNECIIERDRIFDKFYSDKEIDKLNDKYHYFSNFNDLLLFFGMFDLDNLDITDEFINDNLLLKKHGVVIDSSDLDKFDKLCSSCLEALEYLILDYSLSTSSIKDKDLELVEQVKSGINDSVPVKLKKK